MPQLGSEKVEQASDVHDVQEHEQQDVGPHRTVLPDVHKVVAHSFCGCTLVDVPDGESFFRFPLFRWQTCLVMHHQLLSPQHAV